MKKILSFLLICLSISNTVFAFSVDTKGWVDNPELADVVASEIDLKSDLKNDFRVFQTTITNLTNDTIDIFVPTNKTANDEVNKILNSGISFKELMQIPKQIAVDSYKEDVGTGKIAKAHKGLIYIVATGGAIVAGAGLLGVYPQQKTEEYFSHKKIRKEYKKINPNLVDEFTLAPLEQKDFVLFVPIDCKTPLINTNSRSDENDVYSDYHQL